MRISGWFEIAKHLGLPEEGLRERAVEFKLPVKFDGDGEPYAHVVALEAWHADLAAKVSRAAGLMAAEGLEGDETARRVVELRTSPSIVYFIGAGDMVKIGTSTDMKARLFSLQTSSPARLEVLGVFPGGYSVERSLHARFKSSRSHGEWFRKTEDIMSFIREQTRPWEA